MYTYPKSTVSVHQIRTYQGSAGSTFIDLLDCNAERRNSVRLIPGVSFLRKLLRRSPGRPVTFPRYPNNMFRYFSEEE